MANCAQDDITHGKEHMVVKLIKLGKRSLTALLGCLLLLFAAGCSQVYEAGRETQEVEHEEASSSQEFVDAYTASDRS